MTRNGQHLADLLNGPYPHVKTGWRSVRRATKADNLERRLYWHDEIHYKLTNTHRTYNTVMGRLYEQYWLTFSAN